MHSYKDAHSNRHAKQPGHRHAAVTARQVQPVSIPFVQRKAGCSCGGQCPACQSALPIQPKLHVSNPNDHYEREADRVASQVVDSRLPGSGGPQISTLGQTSQLFRISAIESPTEEDAKIVPGSEAMPMAEDEEMPLQRMAEDANMEEDDEEQGPMVQRLRLVGPSPGSSHDRQQVFNRRLGSTRYQGQPLSPAARRFMESRFQRDFSQVRIHNDSQAKYLSDDIQARAFTYGNHIYFNQGEYQPDSPTGKNVLAHELTHVVQQGAASSKEGHGGTAATAPLTSHSNGAAHTKVDRMSSLGPADTPIATGVQPWPTPHPVGSDYIVQTDGGSNVNAWVAYSPYVNNLRYWCHGFSLNTYRNNVWGYSVYSGPSMKTVVHDEYKAVPQANARPGDLAVWNGFQHSAKFTSISFTSGGAIDDTATRLDSKNGQATLDNYSLAELKAVPPYGPHYGVYRHK